MDNAKTFFWLRKFIRIMRQAWNCQKPASAVSSASASTRLIFIFCTGASERRRSKKLSTRSKSCALPEKIKRWGVSNFDVDDMEELLSLEHGPKCAANQVLYNLQNREIEFDLLRWSQANKIPLMAYSPVGHSGALLRNSVLKKIGTAHDATPAQIALAWVLRQPDVIAIPKASTEAHVRDNAGSPEIKLTKEDLTDLDREFPSPKSKRPLPVL
jgi:diketogulonate reductase-like aldo/keto reductase